MPKDMIGSVIRAAVGVPQEHLDLLAKIASKLAQKEPDGRPEGDVWHQYLSKIFKDGLPAWAYLLGVKVTETEIGEFTVNYEEPVKDKLASRAAHTVLNSDKYLHSCSILDKVTMFESALPAGEVRYKASAVSFSAPLTRSVIQAWAHQSKKIMAGSCEGVNLALTTPLLKIARAVPLVLIDECRYDRLEYSYVPTMLEDGDRLRLNFERFEPDWVWDRRWKFLALTQISPEA